VVVVSEKLVALEFRTYWKQYLSSKLLHDKLGEWPGDWTKSEQLQYVCKTTELLLNIPRLDVSLVPRFVNVDFARPHCQNFKINGSPIFVTRISTETLSNVQSRTPSDFKPITSYTTLN